MQEAQKDLVQSLVAQDLDSIFSALQQQGALCARNIRTMDHLVMRQATQTAEAASCRRTALVAAFWHICTICPGASPR